MVMHYFIYLLHQARITFSFMNCEVNDCESYPTYIIEFVMGTNYCTMEDCFL